MMMKCPTVSGQYRCPKDVGHAGDCEVVAAEYTPMPTLAKRVEVLEAQVKTLQLAMAKRLR